MTPLYLGEALSGRILQVGAGQTQVTLGGTEPILFDLERHEIALAGEAGDAIAASVDVVIRHDAGFAIAITPIIDGISQTEQTFSRPAPGGGVEEVRTVQAFLRRRGGRIGARVRQTAATGTVEIVTMTCGYTPLREWP